jgi:hypothetical protein
MRKLPISKIIAEAAKLKKNDDKVEFLRKHECEPLKTILQWTLDPRVNWVLPTGEPPYKECDAPDIDNQLYSEARRLYLFVEHAAPEMKAWRREALFIEILESVHPEDAKLLISAKEKKLPVKGLTVQIINTAFPGLIYEQDNQNA